MILNFMITFYEYGSPTWGHKGTARRQVNFDHQPWEVLTLIFSTSVKHSIVFIDQEVLAL